MNSNNEPKQSSKNIVKLKKQAPQLYDKQGWMLHKIVSKTHDRKETLLTEVTYAKFKLNYIANKQSNTYTTSISMRTEPRF